MIRLALAAALLLPLAASAQPASPFLLPGTPVRPEAIGLGGASVASVTDDPLALFDNPAMLAASGRRPSFRVGASVTPELYGSSALLVGGGAATIGLRPTVGGRPLTIGLSGGYTEINADPASDVFDPAASSEERAYGGGLGLGYDVGPVRVRVGAAAFGRESFEVRDLASGDLVRDRAVTLDLGGAVTAPLLRGPSVDGETDPTASVTVAYAAKDLTLSTDYYERVLPPVEGVAEPEVAHRVGLSASGGLVRQIGARGRLRLVGATASAEGRSGIDESFRVGGAIDLVETVTLRAGYVSRDDGDEWTSFGLSVSIDGLVRAIGTASGTAATIALSDRLTARVDLARLDAGGDVQTDYAGFTLGWRP